MEPSKPAQACAGSYWSGPDQSKYSVSYCERYPTPNCLHSILVKPRASFHPAHLAVLQVSIFKYPAHPGKLQAPHRRHPAHCFSGPLAAAAQVPTKRKTRANVTSLQRAHKKKRAHKKGSTVGAIPPAGASATKKRVRAAAPPWRKESSPSTLAQRGAASCSGRDRRLRASAGGGRMARRWWR